MTIKETKKACKWDPTSINYVSTCVGARGSTATSRSRLRKREPFSPGDVARKRARTCDNARGIICRIFGYIKKIKDWVSIIKLKISRIPFRPSIIIDVITWFFSIQKRKVFEIILKFRRRRNTLLNLMSGINEGDVLN